MRLLIRPVRFAWALVTVSVGAGVVGVGSGVAVAEVRGAEEDDASPSPSTSGSDEAGRLLAWVAGVPIAVVVAVSEEVDVEDGPSTVIRILRECSNMSWVRTPSIRTAVEDYRIAGGVRTRSASQKGDDLGGRTNIPRRIHKAGIRPIRGMGRGKELPPKP